MAATSTPQKQYRVQPDVDVQDPRDWLTPVEDTNCLGLYLYNPMHTFGEDTHPSLEAMERSSVIETFNTVRVEHDAEVAAKAAQRYARLVFNHPHATVTLHTVTGYSQGDVWHVMAYDPCTDGKPSQVESYLAVFGQYLRGDVWLITQFHLEECNLGHGHEMDLEVTCGIYANTPETALSEYRRDHI